jgi:hypothetical protein
MLMFVDLADAAFGKLLNTPKPKQKGEWKNGNCCVCKNSVFNGTNCRACGNHVHKRCAIKKDFNTNSSRKEDLQWACNKCISTHVWGPEANEKLSSYNYSISSEKERARKVV